MSTCRSCGAEILWAITEKGKPMPLDAAPVEAADARQGLFEIAHTGEGTFAIPSRPVPARFVSHFATCPNADSHRKR